MKKPVYLQSYLPETPQVFNRIKLLTAWAFFKYSNGRYSDNIDFDVVRWAADYAPNWPDGDSSLPIVFNIETLPFVTRDKPHRDHIHDQLADIAKIYRNHPKHHGKALGFYSIMPQRDFWRGVEGADGPEGIKKWHEENKFFLGGLDDETLADNRGLSAYMDRIYPSLYYWYPQHEEKFYRYVDKNLEQAAIYNKPIIPFVSPNYYPSREFYPDGMWGRMLGHVINHPLSDGVVIWVMPGGGIEKFSASQNWWQETLSVT